MTTDAAGQRASVLLADRKWRRRASSWLLSPILAFGLGAGPSFVYIGIRAKRSAWWIIGIGYLVVSFSGLIVLSTAPVDTTQANVGGFTWLIAWIVGLIHALIVNPEWLRFRATEVANRTPQSEFVPQVRQDHKETAQTLAPDPGTKSRERSMDPDPVAVQASGSLSPTTPAMGRIFVSYRRQDTAFPAVALYERLAQRFGPEQVFKDVDNVELGEDFVTKITEAVASCDILLALIGQRWVDITDADGTRRLEDPEDFVRLEIEAALDRGVLLIPILVEGAIMPRSDRLPPSVSPLVRRQALELSPNRFAADTERLVRVIERSLANVAHSSSQHARQGPEVVRPKFCPNCADPVDVGETTCDKCGMKLA